MDKKLKEIEIENYIIFIYLILLFIYLYANNIEVNYIKYRNIEDKENYRLLLYTVFITTFLISLFYTIENLKELKYSDNIEVFQLNKLSVIANILVLIASIIIIYIIYKDKDINLEVSP